LAAAFLVYLMPVKQRQAATCEPHTILVMYLLGSADHLLQPFAQQPVPDIMHGLHCSWRGSLSFSPSTTILSTAPAITSQLAVFAIHDGRASAIAFEPRGAGSPLSSTTHSAADRRLVIPSAHSTGNVPQLHSCS
jgi:hypothetical protein